LPAQGNKPPDILPAREMELCPPVTPTKPAANAHG